MTIRNPLFDPRSDYNKRRVAVEPREKLQGYFHWLSEFKALAQRQAEDDSSIKQGPILQLPPAKKPSKSAPGMTGRRQAADEGLRPPPVEVLGCRDETPEGIEVLKPEEAVASMPEEKGRFHLSVTVKVGGWRSPCLCRAYVLEPSHCQQLLKAVGLPSTVDVLNEHALRTIFGRTALNTHPGLIRLLASVPELEGRFQNAEVLLKVELPVDEPLVTRTDFFQRNCLIVAVLENQLLPESFDAAPAR